MNTLIGLILGVITLIFLAFLVLMLQRLRIRFTWNRAEILRQKQQYHSAILFYEKVIKLSKQISMDLKKNQLGGILFNNLSFCYYRLGRLAEAREGYEQALEIIRNTLGKQTESYAAILDNLAQLNQDMGRLAEAIKGYEQALEITGNTAGEQTESYAAILNNLAQLNQNMGRLAEARKGFIKALEITENIALEKTKTKLYATILSNLAGLNQEMGRLEEAREGFVKALEIQRNTVGEQTKSYAITLQNLAKLDQKMGRLEEAREEFVKALDILKNTVGEQTESYATTLSNLARLNQEMGRLEEARKKYKQALEIKRNTVGEQTESYATTLSNLAGLNQEMGKLEEARKKYKQALEIKRNTVGEQAESYAITLSNLAKLNQEMGRLAEAREGFVKALEIKRNTVEDQSVSYGATLNNLAILNQEMGRLAEAREGYERALEILKNTVGEQTESYATTLSNLAGLNQEMGRLAEAREGYEQALEIKRSTVGEQTESYAITLNNLARLNQEMGRLAEARERLQQALEIKGNTVGESTNSYAITLNNLAGLNQEMGRLAEAREGFVKALEIKRNTVGEQTESYATTLHNLATLEVADNNPLTAFPLFQQVEEIHLKLIEQVFLVSSDRQRLDYLQQNYHHLEIFLSFVLEYLPHHQEAVLFAYDYVLRRKAIASETAFKQHLAILSGRYPHLAHKLEQKRQLTEQITFLRLQDKPFIEKYAYIAQLEQQKQQIEQELSKNIDFRLFSELETATRRAVALALPEGSTLVEFVRFRVYDFKNSQFPSARYLGFILPAQAEDNITMIDLGEADTIDRLIQVFRESIIDESGSRVNLPTKTTKTVGQENQEKQQQKTQLRELIFDRLKPHITPEIYIAPDSLLNLIPFDVLPTENKRYLMDEYNFNYLSVGRDILRFNLNFDNTTTEPLIIANPDYNLTLSPHAPVSSWETELDPENRENRVKIQQNLRQSSQQIEFTPLPGTEVEGRKIAEKLQVTPITDIHALKTKISKNQRTPIILHISTHGYYLDDIPLPDKTPSTLTSGDAHPPILGEGADINPLLRSGLACAGANTALKKGKLPLEAEDGILTADDITYINLFGCELVVASACQTALGKIESGDTITGFRRSFIQSGAKTLIVSLWSVPDVATAILMQNFYYYLLQEKRSKADSLKQAKRDICHLTIDAMRQEWLTPQAIQWAENYSKGIGEHLRELSQKAENYRPYEHPKHWAAFICLGSPAPLSN